MQLLLKRSRQEIIRNALEVVVENTPITNLNAGSIARSIIEATSGEYQTLYEFAEDVLNNGFLSKADDDHLDLIGTMFNYPRRTEVVINQDTGAQEEQLIDEETYKFELSKRVTTAVSSNEEAVRLACLAIPGVQDILGKEYSHGTGSFSFILTTLNGFDAESVKLEMENAIKDIKGYGIKPTVLLPRDIPLEIRMQVILKEGTSEADSVRYSVESDLMNYFGNFITGQEFIYNDFIQETMNIDDSIVDFKILAFYLDEVPALLTNHAVLDEERIRPRLINVL